MCFDTVDWATGRGLACKKLGIGGDKMVTTFTYQFGEDRCTQFRVIMVTDQQTHIPTNKPTYRTDYNTLCRS